MVCISEINALISLLIMVGVLSQKEMRATIKDNDWIVFVIIMLIATSIINLKC
ncbi:MAG: hypothetical protein ABIE55_02490 [Candidatus Aenigmatarchaeota archaeon]